MRIGFTGTQVGMTAAQKRVLADLLSSRSGEFHHGDCVGADAEAHRIAVSLGLEPVIHPPSDPNKRAFCNASRVMKPLPYLTRNRNIVLMSELMLATPAQSHNTLRSGTWSTIRFARFKRREMIVIGPDGEILD